jgi:hypothetical protein
MRKIELQNYLVELTRENGEVESIEEAEIVEGNGSILVEEDDYRKLRQAFETIQGFTKNDVELVKRVLEAEEIEVGEVDPRTQKKPIKGRREK